MVLIIASCSSGGGRRHSDADIDEEDMDTSEVGPDDEVYTDGYFCESLRAIIFRLDVAGHRFEEIRPSEPDGRVHARSEIVDERTNLTQVFEEQPSTKDERRSIFLGTFLL